MPCNLNFNQCNGGCSFPRPIFNCRCRLLSILNSTDLEVVNPPLVTSSLILSSIFPQTVVSNGIIQSVEAFLSGNDIILTNGTFMLGEGRYLVSYALTGTIATNGVFSVGINQDGFLVTGSTSSTSGTAGTNANLTNSVIINVTTVSSLITLINNNSLAQGVTSGNITIQKLQ